MIFPVSERRPAGFPIRPGGRAVLLLVLTLACVRGTGGYAVAAEHAGPKVDLSLSLWPSTGGSSWSHDASAAQPLLGSPTSRLDYSGVESTVIELRAKMGLPAGFRAEIAYGAGDAGGGHLDDTDYVSAQGAAAFGTTVSGEHAYSETASEVSGDAVHYFDAKLDKALYRQGKGAGAAGVMVRFVDWTEAYVARGVIQTVCTAPTRLCAPAGTSRFAGREVVTGDARWRALFLGAWAEKRVGERFTLSGELALSPLADLSSEDRHLRRTDLQRDPSFRLAGRGRAATASISLEYRFGARLVGGLGARYWRAEVRNEDRGFTGYPAGGEAFTTPLRRFETERYGLTLTVVYTLGGAPAPD